MAEVRLDGLAFELAGAVSVSKRPSVPGDPSSLHVAEWKVDGPDLTSFEQILPGSQEGYLGREYGDGTDGRWEGVDTLGALITTVPLSTHDKVIAGLQYGTATAAYGTTFRYGNAPAAASAVGAAIYGPYLFVARDHHPAKVQISDMTLKRTGITLSAPATSIVRTTSLNTLGSSEEVSIGMDSSPYVVLTAAATHPNTDTWSVNTAAAEQRAFGIAPTGIVGMKGQTVQENILTGVVTMHSPNWQTRTTIRNKAIQFNSFALDGNLWVLGTSDGPYMLDSATAEFFPVIDEIDNDNEHTQQMTTWFPIGVVIPLRGGLRQQKNRRGNGFGPEKFDWNSSPIQGHVHGVAGSARWLYTTVHNDADSTLWLLAWGEFHPGDPTRHQHLLAPHVIAKLSTSLDSKFLKYIGRVNGLRASETLVGAIGADLFHMAIGSAGREIEDTTYPYAAAGTTHFTELRRQPGMIKDTAYFEFRSNNCIATRTMTVGASFDGKTAVTFTGALKDDNGASVNGVVDTNGLQRIYALDDEGAPRVDTSGETCKPQMAYTRPAATTTTAPQLVGTLRWHYYTRGASTRVWEFPVTLSDDARAKAWEREARLLDLQAGLPFKMVLDGKETWVKAGSVQVTEHRATVQLIEWHSPYTDRP